MTAKVIVWPGQTHQPKSAEAAAKVFCDIETALENYRLKVVELAKRPENDPWRRLAVSTLHDLAYEVKRMSSSFGEPIKVSGDRVSDPAYR